MLKNGVVCSKAFERGKRKRLGRYGVRNGDCSWAIGNVPRVDWSCPIDIPFKEVLTDTVGKVVVGLDLLLDKIHDPQIDVCHEAAATVNRLGDVVNDLVNDGLNPVLGDIGTVYCELKNDVEQIEAYLQIITDLLNGNLLALIQMWLYDWFPFLSLQTIYYILIVILIVFLVAVFGGIIAFLKLFI